MSINLYFCLRQCSTSIVLRTLLLGLDCEILCHFEDVVWSSVDVRRLSQQLILVSVHFKLSESTVHRVGVHLKDSGHTLLDSSPSITIASLDNTLRRRI